MPLVILAVVLLLVLFGPHWWVQRTLRRYDRPRPDFPGTGGEFARHLLGRLAMEGVVVETSDRGDHYDPVARAVRLSEERFNGRSLTAVTVAAHEVGHALQHHLGYRPLAWRTRMAGLATAAQQLGSALFLLAPLLAGISRAPSTAAILLLGAVASFGSAALVHLLTLPVEWDASFRRALPLLEAGGYLEPADQAAAHRILAAAALTYVAGALASLLNLWRWLRWLRR